MKNNKGEVNTWVMVVGIVIIALIMVYGFALTGVNEEALADSIVTGLLAGTIGQVNNTPVDNVDPVVEEEETASINLQSYDWEDLAWDAIEDEFEDEDRFYTCNGHEFDDDEYDIDVEDISVRTHRNGDVTVTLEVEFDFDDNSDERDCKVDRTFEVFWDDDDVEDEDWNEAEVTWIIPQISPSA